VHTQPAGNMPPLAASPRSRVWWPRLLAFVLFLFTAFEAGLVRHADEEKASTFND
jgi:ABC-type multidrug transport system permease subunit